MRAEKPTILQIVPALDTGGAELSAIEIAGAVVAAGGRALVATSGGRMADRVTAAGGELIAMPVDTKNPLAIARNAARLARLIETERIDLVHARSRAPAWSGLFAAHRTGRPFVTTYHGAYNEQGPVKRLYNSVMARGDAVIANSKYTARLIAERYGTPAERIAVIYRGVDEAAFDPARVAAGRVAALRTAWGAREGERIILHAARLTAWKGQGVVIEAAGRLRRAGLLEGVLVALAGDEQGRTGYRAELARRIESAGLADRVRLVGHVSDMPAAFLAAHAAVVASIEPEAFGRAGVEAQAMGCPVISTDIGAPPETVLAAPAVTDAEATGWLVPPGSAEALADALSSALRLTPARHREMAGRARTHATRRFSLWAMRHATMQVYDRLLGVNLAERFSHACPPLDRT